MNRIGEWDVRVIKTLEPVTRVTSDGPADEAVGALGNALQAQGYTVKPRSGSGFKAYRRDWRDLVGKVFVGGGNRATAYVYAETEDAHTVRVRLRPTHASGPNEGIVPAINGALASLEQAGRTVSITPWEQR